MKRLYFILPVIVFLSAVLLVEMAGQIYFYTNTGQGLIAILLNETRYINDEESGQKLLNPAYSRPGFRINSLGLRSDEIEKGSDRHLLFIGASTVMGELADSNEETFSYLVAEKLSRRMNDSYRAINAGIAGYRIADQLAMLERIAGRVKPDFILIYPGFNDVSDYCQAQRGEDGSVLPEWWVSFRMIRRKTEPFRPAAPMHASGKVEEFDTSQFENTLSELIEKAKSYSRYVIVMTGGRAFSPNQEPELQWRLSASVRGYASCLSMAQLNEAYDLYNDAIRRVAGNLGVSVIDVARELPSGTAYFGDATHFNRRGEELLSDKITDVILSSRLAGRGG